jgi:hypothetical protein
MPKALLILILLFCQEQTTETVAITLSKDSPAIILSRKEAEAQFRQLCADGSDDKKLRALGAALNPMPDWLQMVMNGDASVCQRNPKPIIPVPLLSGN